MKKQFLTIRQFAELLMSYNLSKFAQAQSVTEPKLNKKSRESGLPCPFSKVLNVRDLNIQLNYNFEGQVGKREVKEGADAPTFEASEHAWARHIKGALATHKGEVEGMSDEAVKMMNIDLLPLERLYMPYVKVRVDEQKYIADGKEVSKDVLIPYFPPKSDYDNQPIENKVRVEYMKLTSIKTFVCDNTEYQIIAG